MKLSNLYIYLILAITSLSVLTGRAAPPAFSYGPDPITVTLERRLAECRTSRDSLLVLENLYDLSQQYRPWLSDSISERIYDTALRAKDNTTALEMLRVRASTHAADDSVMNIMLRRVRQFPASEDARSTEAFITILINGNAARSQGTVDCDSIFSEEIKQYTLNPPKDLYDRIVLLHSVCVNLGRETRGELLSEYMAQLGELVDKLPPSEYAIRNAYYVQSAMIFNEAGHPARALEQDRRLLRAMDSLEHVYAKRGRPYRYYDANRYIVYSRMLGAWDKMKPGEVETYYRKAIKIRDNDVRAYNSYQANPRPDIYYAMAREDYPTALRLLKGCINNPRNKSYRFLYLRNLIICAGKTGDRETQLQAYDDYFKLLEEELDRRVKERYKELQIIYDVNAMQARYDQLKDEKRQSENEMQRDIIVISLVSIVILIGLIIFLAVLWRRAKRLAARLVQSNDDLKRESDSLILSQQELTKARDRAERTSNFKSDFIKNLSHEVSIPLKAISEYCHLIIDCSDFTGKPYLQRYSELIDDNCRLLGSIASDVLHMAEIDSETLEIVKAPTDMYKAVTAAVDTAAPYLERKGLEITFDENSPALDIVTDTRRLHQILLNLLSNAAKFTREGSVVVSYDRSEDGTSVLLSVTDTGMGIPPEQAEYIFERFAKLDREAQGIGLGLTISRLLARLLGGDLRLDTGYTHGARFILTLPLRPK